VAAIGAGEAAAWRQTLTRTVRDGQRRALFVAEACGQVVARTDRVNHRVILRDRPVSSHMYR
jgi:hypothetical protein